MKVMLPFSHKKEYLVFCCRGGRNFPLLGSINQTGMTQVNKRKITKYIYIPMYEKSYTMRESQRPPQT